MTGFGKVGAEKNKVYRVFFVFLKKAFVGEATTFNFRTKFLRVSMIRGIKGPKSSFFNSKIIKFIFSVRVESKKRLSNYPFRVMLELLSTNFFSIKQLTVRTQKFFLAKCLILTTKKGPL
jgi:hypothetical protein